MSRNIYEPLIRTLQFEFEQVKQNNILNLKRIYDVTEQQFQALGFRDASDRAVENILVLRLDVMGDFILISAFLRELRANYPSARITLVVSQHIYPLAELCPYVNEVLAFDTRLPPFQLDPLTTLRRVAEFVSTHLWSRRFTRCFCPQSGGDKFPTILMSFFSGAMERIGYNYPVEFAPIFFNRNITAPKSSAHEVIRSLQLLDAVGLSVRRTDLELWYGAEDVRTVGAMLEKLSPDRKRIVIGLGAGNLNRKYPVAQYAVALNEIGRRGADFVLVGGSAEVEAARELESLLVEGSVVNLAGVINLRETVTAIALSDMYIGNDSGVMHAAAAAHIPVIVIYRESRDQGEAMFAMSYASEYHIFAPWQTLSVSLRPEHALDECRKGLMYGGCSRDEPHCITQIEPREIVEAYDRLMYMLEHRSRLAPLDCRTFFRT